MTTRTNAKTPTSADHKHSHALKAVDAQLAVLNDAIRSLDARVAALEAPAPPPPPDPPTIGSYNELVAAGAAAAPGGVVDCDGETFAVPDAGLLLDRSITLRNAHLTSTRKSGSAANGVVRVTADGAMLDMVDVEGGFVGIVLDGAADVQVLGCDIRDTVYAGIMGLSALDCEIAACVVNGVRPIDGANGHNAYGIALSSLAGRPVSARVVVHGNGVYNVPTWHGLDTHGGMDITFRDNYVSACRRAIFLTNAPARVICTGNLLTAPTAAEQAQTPPGRGPVLLPHRHQRDHHRRWLWRDPRQHRRRLARWSLVEPVRPRLLHVLGQQPGDPVTVRSFLRIWRGNAAIEEGSALWEDIEALASEVDHLDVERLAQACHRGGNGTCLNWEPGFLPHEKHEEMEAHRREALAIARAYAEGSGER